MPEVRHGSVSVAAGSDPALLPTLSTTASPPAGAAPPSSSLPNVDATRPQPQQNLSSQSADTVVPVTKQMSPMRRLSRAISRQTSANNNADANGSNGDLPGRKSLSYALREPAEAYYDSRAAGRKEYKRRAKDLQEYYEDKPELLPQLPFTWHHGKKRYRLWFFAFMVFVDASAVPIALYYGLRYAGNVPNHIIFIVVTTIWGGPPYLEFAIRTLRLIKKERFYRPLNMESRWGCDFLTWLGSITIFVLTALFIIGSAPRHTWLRVVAMAAVSILYCLGGALLLIEMYSLYGRPAPFRLSSTAKGEPVNAGAYYFIEDVLAVNAGCGRPYREALAARYKASPVFRKLMSEMSLFWSIPALILAVMLTFVACLPWVPEDWSYGVCFTAPFLWAVIWGLFTIPWVKRRMAQEKREWQAGRVPEKLPLPSPGSDDGATIAVPVAAATHSPV